MMNDAITAMKRDCRLRKRGTIHSIDIDRGMLALMEWKTEVGWFFALDPSTRCLSNGKPIAAGNLKPGDPVMVRYEERGDEFLAKVIRILPIDLSAMQNP
jgi:hypothetical protein